MLPAAADGHEIVHEYVSPPSTPSSTIRLQWAGHGSTTRRCSDEKVLTLAWLKFAPVGSYSRDRVHDPCYCWPWMHAESNLSKVARILHCVQQPYLAWYLAALWSEKLGATAIFSLCCTCGASPMHQK